VIRDAGDSALLLELDAVIDPAVNASAIGIAAAIAAERIAGVRDVVPTYRSVAVHFDPLVSDVEQLRGALQRAADTAPAARTGALIEIPVAYGGDNGPDLDEVAAFAHLSPSAVIERHSAREYRVFMLGFLPGFTYMGTVDEAIAAPRKATPRTRIPAGSVGIAGRQTGIYPRQSPGGWQLIGRTDVRIFDPAREPPSLFAPGDRVRFVAATRTSEPRTVEPRAPEPRVPSPGSPVPSPGSRVPSPDPRVPSPESRSITVLTPGLFTTIQDDGRWGHQDRGVPVAGPMDRVAYRLANALVGNPPGAAVLEATVLGPELRVEQPMRIAITGADLSASADGRAMALNSVLTCAAGSVLRFGERKSGARAYIAFDGGIDAPQVLGSRATHVVSGLGGIDGRALRAGDRLSLGHAWDGPLRRVPPAMDVARRTGSTGGARLRVMRGPQDDFFDERAFDWLRSARFAISPQSDRMGYRLTVDTPRATNDAPRTAAALMISDATVMGGLQIPPSGDPILLMADRQTTGGYPQIATVITADLPLAGQLAPGDWLEFALCSRDEAIAVLRQQEQTLRQQEEALRGI